MLEEDEFLTKSKFAKMIEHNVAQKKHSYIDAVIDVCEDMQLDLTDVKKFISPVIENKIEAEARRLNFLPRGNVLPVD